MKNQSKTIGIRCDCKTWESLIILGKFSGKKISTIVREMLNAYCKTLLDRMPEGKLNEIKEQIKEKK